MRRIATLIAMTVALALLMQCHHEKTTDLTNWGAHCELQGQAGRLYDSLAALGDTSAAIDSTIAFLRRSSSVAWTVYNGCNGISVRYADSIPGIILTSRVASRTSTSLASYGQRESNAPTVSTAGGVVPSKNGASLIAPIYTDAHDFVQPKYAAMLDNLPKVGFPQQVDLYNDAKVTLDLLSSLPGKGVLHFDGHAGPYPSETDLREVYFVTGELVNGSTDSEYGRSIFNGDVPLVTVGKYTNLYAVSPAFIKTYNDGNWAPFKPLVYGSFCYSSRGTWQATMMDMGASAYLGWDGKVTFGEDCAWACSLYKFMCDTPTTDPYTCTISAFEWKYIYYYWHTGQTGARLCFSGDPSVTFQQPVPAGWYVGGYCPVFGFAGANLSTSGQLDISFAADSSIPPKYPMACITFYNAASLTPGTTVRPDEFSLWYGSDSGFMVWGEAQVYVNLTEAEFTSPFGKVSGSVVGYVIAVPPRDPGDTLPLPIYGSFNNVTVNVLPSPDAAPGSPAAGVATIRNRLKRAVAAKSTTGIGR